MEDIVGPATTKCGCNGDDNLWLPSNSNKDVVPETGVACKGSNTLQHRVDGMETKIIMLTRKFEALWNTQHSHCDHLADVYQDLGQLVQHSYPGLPSMAASVTTENGLSAEELCENTISTAVMDVLADFKGEIVRRGESTEQQLNAMARDVQSLQLSLEECKKENAVLRALLQAQQEFTRELAGKPQETPGLTAQQCQNLVDEARQQLMAEIAKSRKEELQGFDKRLGKAEKAVYKELDVRCFNAAANAEEQVKKLLAQHVESSKTDLQTNDSKVAALRATVDGYVGRIESAEKAVLSLREDAVRRQEEVAATSPTAGSATVKEVKSRLQLLSAEVQEHRTEIERISNEASLEGAFVEVKDWLLDLEKRVMSRGEMLEIVNRFEAQFAAVNRDLHVLANRLTYDEGES